MLYQLSTHVVDSHKFMVVLLKMKFAGVMVVLVHLGTLFITESCFLDWWKVHGVGK